MPDTPNPNTTPPKPTSLPMIDISPYLSPTSTPSSRKEVSTALSHACTTYGFFYLTGHGIPQATLSEVLSLARAFFSLPLAQKNKIKRYNAGGSEGGDGARGYQGIGENVTKGKKDVHEAVDLYREWDHAPREEGAGGKGTWKTLNGRNLWPEEPGELSGVYEGYIGEVKRVGTAVVRAMGEALGLPSPKDTDSAGGKEEEDSEIFVRNTESSFWVMRLIGYPPLATPFHASASADIEEFSCGEHTDYGCVTLLLADSTPGALQVLLKDGVTWVDADPVPGAFVVNIGDMVERWTNGIWKSTKHRVVHKGKGYRVSVPFFFEPNFEAVVRPLGKCVGDSGREPVHGGSTYGEHLLGKVSGNFYGGEEGSG